MKRIFAFTSRHATVLKIALVVVSILSIIIAAGAPNCFDP